MNVEDVESRKSEKDPLEEMFDRQRELMIKYHDIEKKNGVGSGAILPEKFDIDDPRCQYICKDFAWRITEELAECMEAPRSYEKHRFEEAADALHFILELLIMNGIGAEDFPIYQTGDDRLKSLYKYSPGLPTIQYGFMILIIELGMAMNCLKNKPWKQTQMETDVAKFHEQLKRVLVLWTSFAEAIGMTYEKAYDYYFKKSEVNKFRQRSQY
jgi:hypothetical protein